MAATRILVSIAALLGCTAGFAVAQPGQQPGSPTKSSATLLAEPPPPLLPPAFAGKPRQGDIVDIPSPAGADAAHAEVLQEDGFSGASRATYTGDGGSGWSVTVFRFEDATGAYSAFTFFRDPAMRSESAGDDAAASARLFLARTDASLLLVQPLPGHPGDAATLALAVKALLKGLPHAAGVSAVAPPLPRYLPAQHLDRATLHYAIGPASYNGPIPVGSIAFKRDAEVATAAYHLPDGKAATLTLIMSPTPQLATEQVKTVAALPDASLHRAARQIGPLAAIVSGADVAPAAANLLLDQIHYSTNITINETDAQSPEVAKAAKLLVSIAEITGLLALAALIVGGSLGFGRVFYRRMRGKPDSSLHDEQFIRLKL